MAHLSSHSDSLMAPFRPATLAFFGGCGWSDLFSIHCTRSSHISGILGHTRLILPYLRPMKHPTLEIRFASTIWGPSGVWATSHPMVKACGAISL